MENPLIAVIAQEEAKLRMLEDAVASHKVRVATLKSMLDVGELDIFLARKIGTPRKTLVEASPRPTINNIEDAPGQAAPESQKQRKKGSVKYALLNCLTDHPQHINEIIARATAAGYPLSYDRVRTQLWVFKTKDQLAVSTEDAHYSISEKGKEFLKNGRDQQES